MNIRIASVAVWLGAEKRLLLMGRRRDTGLWTLPGGHLEAEESPEAGARRELAEEAGLRVQELQYLGSGTVRPAGKNLSIHCFEAVLEAGQEPDSSQDPDEEVETWQWIETPLPSRVADNLQAKNNVTLRLLGLQEGPVESIPLSKGNKFWRARDGLAIPHGSNPDREAWDKAYIQRLTEAFADGDGSRLRPLLVPARESLGSHFVHGAVGAGGRDRRSFYLRMLAGGDRLPPVVVQKDGIGYRLIDGNARLDAALKHMARKKLPVLNLQALELLPLKPKGLKRSEEQADTGLSRRGNQIWAHDYDDDGNLRGHAWAQLGPDGSLHFPRGSVWVRPDSRGLGIGQQLLASLYRHPGLTSVTAETHEGLHRELAANHGLLWGQQRLSRTPNPFLAKMAIEDFRAGRRISSANQDKIWGSHESRYQLFGAVDNIYDYNHLLTPLQRQDYKLLVAEKKISANAPAYYGLSADQDRNGYQAFLLHGGSGRLETLGRTGAREVGAGKIYLGYSYLAAEHRHKGLGLKLYEALYRHAISKGIHTVRGDVHSTDAHRTHSSLARKHGLNYQAIPTGEYRFGSTAFDDAFGDYEYKLTRAEDLEALMSQISPLKKSWLQAMAAAGMLSLGQAQAQTQEAQAKETQAQDAGVPWTSEGLHESLWPIAILESSWGLNVNHKANAKGDFHTAFGALGFKPVTAHEEYMKTPALQKKYPGLEEPKAFLDAFKANPRFYNELAGQHFHRLERRHGSLPAAAFAWRWGTGACSRAEPAAIQGDSYVQKYQHMLLEHRRQKGLTADAGFPILSTAVTTTER